jgi:hypothetical protein
MTRVDEIVEMYSDESFLTADGFDEAIIGVDESSMRLVYSVTKCLEILQAQGMDETDALEYFSYNVSGAYMGEKTPIWCNDNMFQI